MSATVSKKHARIEVECIIDAIDEFDDECEKAQYTDTEHVWELLNSIRSGAKLIRRALK